MDNFKYFPFHIEAITIHFHKNRRTVVTERYVVHLDIHFFYSTNIIIHAFLLQYTERKEKK